MMDLSVNSPWTNSKLSEEQWRIQALNEIDLALAEKSLAEYGKQAWHVVEPVTRYLHSWHIDAIAEHLEAVTVGQIRNLAINVPPRCEKSLLVSVFWPTWVWTRRPAVRWIFASYAQSLSIRDSLKCRRLIESPWYQARWGHMFRLTGDQNAKMRFDNSATGYRIATSVGGALTGEGGDFLVVDDPHNVIEAESDTIRDSTLTWWDESMSTRGNDPKTVGRVIVQQRVHEADLTGHILEQGGYVHLKLPMRFDPKQPCRIEVTGWHDPRTEEGELLWPERYGEAEVVDLEMRLGSYGSAGQLQQEPAPRGGGKLQREWFRIVDDTPASLESLRWWDLAATDEKEAKRTKRDPDWTAGARVGISDGVIYIIDIQRERLSPNGVEALVKQTAELDGRRIAVWMEQEPGASGVNTINYYTRLLLGYEFHGERTTGPKGEFLRPFAAQAEAGNVRLLRGIWNKAFLDEATAFPNGKHDDMIDAVLKAFAKLTQGTAGVWGR